MDSARAAENESTAPRVGAILDLTCGLRQCEFPGETGREGTMSKTFDTIIVGGGAAGCVLAARLSAQSSRNVLLIEAGQDYPPGQEPADILDTYCTSYYNRDYKWPGLKAHWRLRDNSPAVGFEQGRVIGGGSSVMGMVALRGTPDDYAEWESQGAAGWGWRDVLPYFKRLENDTDFGGELHAHDGPIPIRRTPRHQWPPLSNAVATYAAERQVPYIADMNADFRDGCCALPLSATTSRRGSSALCYLDASVRARPNLTIVDRAKVTGLLFENRAVVGVTAMVGGEDAAEQSFRAGEVVLSAGAVHTPAILMRAGIGPARALRDLGIAVVADLPGVGANLQNHPLLFIGLHLRPEARQSTALRPHPVTCFRYSSGLPGAVASDMYIAAHSKSSWNALGAQIANFNTTIFKPVSRGAVTLYSASANELPRIEFNFASEELDLRRLMDGFRRVVEMVHSDTIRPCYDAVFPIQFTDRLRQLNLRTRGNALKTAALAKIIDLVPGAGSFAFSRLTSSHLDLQSLVADDDALAEHVRRNVGGTFHVAGTCKMGRPEDRDAVVDTAGRVRGIAGLRIADASIMPTVPRGNTNIPTVMIGEKIADAILAAPRVMAA
jgi:5-(hydroxymethyl)furfural/furfural oxidase